jgi:hypothetical protein
MWHYWGTNASHPFKYSQTKKVVYHFSEITIDVLVLKGMRRWASAAQIWLLC